MQVYCTYSIVMSSSVSTGSGSVEDCALEDFIIDSSDGESSTSDEADTDTDLQDLYESFDFEDEASRSQSLSQAEARGDTAESFRMETTDRSFCLHQTALYAGSAITSLQSNLLIFQYAIRHGLTAKAFTELLQLLSVHLPQKASIPKTVHSFKRFFIDAFPEAQAVQHFYCSCCQRPLSSPTASCFGSGCSGGNNSMYITIPVAPQLKRMMEGIVT